MTDQNDGQDTDMKQVDLVDAKRIFSKLVAQAAAGETVCGMRAANR
jgi:hypothetical protein